MNDDYIKIQNEKLQIKILHPGKKYRRSRFDWCGIIEQVILNKEHTFCSRENILSNGKSSYGTGGIGLCSSFEWKNTQLYDQTPIGKYFPIIGVGLLKKKDCSIYSIINEYEILPYKHKIAIENNSVKFVTLPQDCQGIAAYTEKTIKLDKNKLIISNYIKNIGNKNINAKEYCHNFFAFNNIPIGNNYILSVPYSFNLEKRFGSLNADKKEIQIKAFDPQLQKASFWIKGFKNCKTHKLQLKNTINELSVIIEDCFNPYDVYCWCNPNAFCPEVFKEIVLKPNESNSYNRNYYFEE